MTNCLLDIPDKIHQRLKMRAVAEGKTLKEVIIEALGDVVYIDDDGSWKEALNDYMG